MEINELEPSPAFSDRPLGKVKRNGDQIMAKVIWQEMKDRNHSYYPSPIPPGLSVIPSVDVGDIVLHLPPRNQNPILRHFSPNYLLLAPRVFIQKGQVQEEQEHFYEITGIHCVFHLGSCKGT